MFVSQITTVNDFIYKYMYKNTPTQTQNQQNIYYMEYMYTIIKYPIKHTLPKMYTTVHKYRIHLKTHKHPVKIDTTYFMVLFMFNDWWREVIVYFVDIGGIVDHHCFKLN